MEMRTRADVGSPWLPVAIMITRSRGSWRRLVHRYDCARRRAQVAHIGSHLDIVAHAAPNDGYLAVVADGGVDDLLDAGY